MIRCPRILFVLSALAIACFSQGAQSQNPPKHMVFEGTSIEGQMGSLKALIVTSEKRPDFSPMALKLAHQKWEVKSLNKKLTEKDWYESLFPVKISK